MAETGVCGRWPRRTPALLAAALLLCAAFAAPAAPAAEVAGLRAAVERAAEAGATDADVRALADIARRQDVRFQNRTAVALALLGYPREALLLFTVEAREPAERFRQLTRAAGWAIAAADAARGRELAWEAVRTADTATDHRYGLSILVEAYRLDDGLESLVELFAREQQPSREVQATWTALLRELGHGEEKGLPAGEPATPEEYAALSEYHLGVGNNVAAEKLWGEFIERNLADRARLLAGAQAMSEMGMDAIAIEGVERHQRSYGVDLTLLGFLFELHRERGDSAAARKVLARMDEVLPAGSTGRAALAENYFRLNLPEKALEVWTALERAAGGLDYAGNLRVAALQAATGQSAQALQTWQKLWRQAASPARREFVQERLIATAREQGRLGEMEAELEAALAAGSSGLPEARLLVSMQTTAGDAAAAVSSIERLFAQFGLDAVERLKEQARVYRAAGKQAQFTQVFRRLMEIDPDNAGDYMRAIVLQRIEQPGGDREAQIESLLVEWRRLDARVDPGFEAGVLMRAGLLDRAIDVYKQAIEADPGARDHYLLLAEALKKRNRQEEALSLLRALAEEASTDELFLTAIDGLLNTVTGFPGNPLEPAAAAHIRWARDRILERLITRTDELWIYQLLMDVNEELRDGRAYLSAAENSLALAGQQRSAVLRQLLTVTTLPERPGPSMGLRIDDIALHLGYGRRLVALGEELPPDVYLDLGKAFLENKDAQGAARAFALAIDSTGRADLMRQAAELFDSRGFAPQALKMLTRAHIRARHDTGIALQLARLQERMGHRDRAHALYSQTLHALLLKQPVRPGPVPRTDPYAIMNGQAGALDGKPVTREYRDHYDLLVHGYLATWPRDDAARKSSVAALEALLESELPGGEWQPYSRVERVARLVGRVAFATRDAALADRTGTRLREHFGAAFVQAPPARKPPPFVQTANVAWLAGDQDRMLTAAGEWAQSGAFRQALAWTEGKLEPKRYRAFAREVLALARADAQFMRQPLLDSFGVNARFLVRLEAGAGEPVFSTREVLAMLMTLAELSEFERSSVSATPYLMGRLQAQDLLEWFRYAAQPVHKPMTYRLALQFWSRLLAGPPLDARSADELARLMDAILTDNKAVATLGPDSVSNQLLVTGIDVGNIRMARQVTDAWRTRLNQRIDYYEPAYLLKAGRIPEAVDAFLALPPPRNTGPDYNLQRKLEELFLPRYTAALQQRLGPTRESFERQLRLFATGMNASARAIPVLEPAVAAFPEDEPFLKGLSAAYSAVGRTRDEAAVLEKLHRLHPDSEAYRASLLQAWLRNDNVLRALELQRAASQESQDLESGSSPRRRAMQPGGAGRPVPDAGPPRMFVGLNRLNDRIAQLTADLAAGKSSEVRSGMRTMWHMAQTDESSNRNQLLDMNLPGPSARKLFDALAEQAFAVEEFEDYLRALDPQERRELYPLTGFLAQAYLHAGRSEEKIALLQQAIGAGTAHEDELTLWLALLAGVRDAPSAVAAGLLRERAQRPDELSQYQSLLMARVFAKGGDGKRAAALYRHLACGMLVVDTRGAAPVPGRQEFDGVLTAVQFIEEASRSLEGTYRAALERDIVKLVEPAAQSGATQWWRYREFVLKVAAASADPVQAWPAYRHVIGAPAADWSAGMLAALGRLQIRAGEFTAAAVTLDLLVTRDGSTDASAFIPGLGADADFAAEVVYMGMLGLPMPFGPGPGGGNVLFSLLMAAEAAGMPLKSQTASVQAAAGRFEPVKLASLLERVAAHGDVGLARELGARAAQDTQNDALLAVLEKLATDAADREQARRWREVRVAAREAREVLNAP